MNYIKCNFTPIFFKFWNGFNKRTLIKSTYMETKWDPENVYNIETMQNKKYAIVVLNRKIKIHPQTVKDLWENAHIRITVDGGTNRWLTFIKTHFQDKEELRPPDIISGDFDSITQETSNYFKEIQRIHTPDQNETDFTKALKILKPLVEEKKIEKIIVIHDTSGRLDQIMANINTLFKSKKLFKINIEIYLISYNSLTWLLNPGKHSIQIPLYLYENKRWCSLLPIGEKTKISTTGLKWDLNNHILEFGGIVSSSNTYSSQIVTINTSNFLLWSMGIFNKADDDND